MEYSYRLIRSNRKTLSLEVTQDLEVLVRAPMYTSDATVKTFFHKHTAWLQKHYAQMETRRMAHPEPSPAQVEALQKAAKAHLPERVEHYARLMDLAPTGISITNAKTRFGSCSAKNRLCFSWRLMAYPPAAVDYVVVHELAHIVHKNHGPDFYALIATILPDWKSRRQLLR